MKPRSNVALVALFLGLVTGSVGAAAKDTRPVAMVMKVSGSTEPALPPRAQIEEGVKVKIPPASRLTFVLFGQCGLYTATGGTASFRRRVASIEGGTIERAAGPCSKVHVLASAEQPLVGGGANLRSVAAAETVGPRPSFVVSGEGAARVTGAQLVADDAVSGRAPIEMVLKDGSLTLSDEMASLRSRRYVLSLKVSKGPVPPAFPLLISTDAEEDRLDVLYVK